MRLSCCQEDFSKALAATARGETIHSKGDTFILSYRTSKHKAMCSKSMVVFWFRLDLIQE